MYTYTTPHTPNISVNNLVFSWPDGTPVFDNFTAHFSGLTSLTADNGAGKSTLLRIIAGELSPESGTLSHTGSIGYLPQLGTLNAYEGTVAALLGIDDIDTAWGRINAGVATEEDFSILENHWDYPDEKASLLSVLNIAEQRLQDPSSTLSGGQKILTALTGLHFQGNDVTLLDEPTNYLDSALRSYAYDLIEHWKGTVLVATHDRELLDRLPAHAHLSQGNMTYFRGSYTDFRAQQDALHQAAIQNAVTQEQELKKAKKKQNAAEHALQHRARTAKKEKDNIPKILAGLKANAAQNSAAKLRATQENKVNKAQEAANHADRAVIGRDPIIFSTGQDIAACSVPAGKKIAHIPVGDSQYILQGPEKVALAGANGSGKSTLLNALVEGKLGEIFTERYGYVSQSTSSHGDAATLDAVDYLRELFPAMELSEVRYALARVGLNGDIPLTPMVDLSGGQQTLVRLLGVLLSQPELLIVDEPTNHLDMATTEALSEFLRDWPGALLIVSHDAHFLKSIGIDHTLELKATQ